MERVLTLLLDCTMVTLLTVSVAVASAPPYRDDFNRFDEFRWDRGDHYLGRSYLALANVNVGKGEIRLGLPA